MTIFQGVDFGNMFAKSSGVFGLHIKSDIQDCFCSFFSVFPGVLSQNCYTGAPWNWPISITTKIMNGVVFLSWKSKTKPRQCCTDLQDGFGVSFIRRPWIHFHWRPPNTLSNANYHRLQANQFWFPLSTAMRNNRLYLATLQV